MKSSRDNLIILTAGGTGGHIYPAETLAVELQQRGCQVMFFTDSRGLDNYHGLLKQLPVQTILSGSVIGKSVFTKVKSLCKVGLGIFQAAFYMLRNRPKAVVGFGGYASFPTAVAALLLRIPLVIHEQNSVMSRTNRILSGFAACTAQSFRNVKNTPSRAKEFLSGMPIRENIIQLHNHPYQTWNNKRPFTIMVLGGSQGAKIFGEVVPQAIALFDDNIQKQFIIYQQCRKGDEAEIEKAYAQLSCSVTISSFFNNMNELYSKTDLIISRSGASSVYEIAAAGVPSILVPLPTAADNHQYYNAKELNDCGGTVLIEQKDFNAALLHSRISEFLQHPEKLQQLSVNAKNCAIIDAPKRLADAILKLK